MYEIVKPIIGLAGVMSTPFRGDKEGNFKQHRAALEALADQHGFEFHAVAQGIYNTAQAQNAADELAEWGADFVLLQASSFAAGDFLYPFTALPWRLGIWAVPEGAPGPKGGLPLNSFTTANLYNSIIRTYLKGYEQPVKWFVGSPSDAQFQTRLRLTVQALRPLINLPGKKVALIGGVAPSFDNLRIDDRALKERLGIDVLHIELGNLLSVARALDESETHQAAATLQQSAARLAEGQEQHILKSARVATALEKMAQDQGFEAAALSCWPQFQTDYNLAVCSVMGQLNTQGLIAACEGDVTSAVSMLLLRYLSGGDVVTLMDMATVDLEDESVLLWHCGPTSPALADERGVTMQSLWLFDGPDGEETGLHNDLVLRPGNASVIGFNTDFDKMLILEGTIDNQKPSYMGSRGWMRDLSLNDAAINLPDLIQTIMHAGFQHHYPFGYGQFSGAALEYCTWAGIAPIQKKPYTDYVL